MLHDVHIAVHIVYINFTFFSKRCFLVYAYLAPAKHGPRPSVRINEGAKENTRVQKLIALNQILNS